MVSDRKIYLEVLDVVNNYTNLYLNDSNKNDEYIKYYDTLSSDYKIFLSKKKYKEVSKAFLEKFYLNDYLANKNVNIFDSCIKKVYLYSNDKYICVVNINENKKAYIGIQLNPTLKKAYIFFLE